MTALDQTTDDSADAAGIVLRARRELAAAIRRGDYKPNQRLVESELTAALAVSRATLRAVFIALEQENYISLEHNRGARVRQFSPVEAVDILDTRVILEAAAAGLAAKRITDEECDRLDAIVAQMADSIAEGDEERHSACNREFHALVVAAARQPLLAQFVAATPYPLVISQYRDTQVLHPRADSLLEHRAIVAALRVRNSMAAEAVMRAHNIEVHRGLAITRSLPRPW
jgi:DNA-binding GntR family transcriptional regulator